MSEEIERTVARKSSIFCRPFAVDFAVLSTSSPGDVGDVVTSGKQGAPGRDVMYGALLCPQYIFYTYVLDLLESLVLLELLDVLQALI